MGDMEMINLKAVLMNLGNRLVQERGFGPAVLPGSGKKDTSPIRQFTDWLNRTPDARDILYEMGYEWPIVPQQHAAPAETNTEPGAPFNEIIRIIREQPVFDPVADAEVVERVADSRQQAISVPISYGRMEWYLTDSEGWAFDVYNAKGVLVKHSRRLGSATTSPRRMCYQILNGKTRVERGD